MSSKNRDSILVSIVMITYGHEKFIIQAIEGVLMQKTNFDIELIIADDCSPDVTENVVKMFLETHPKAHLVKYTKHLQNKGMQPNFIWACQECNGEYIAMCEGDDYWTDPLKLQKQVDFLENNLDYSICFHKIEIKYKEGINPFLIDLNANTPDTTTIYDILKVNYLHTPSVVFRNVGDYPEWFKYAYPGDWPLHIINALHGKLKFIPETMAVYQVHSGGVHSTTAGQIENSLKTYDDLLKELFDRKLNKEYNLALKIYNYNFAYFYGLNKGNYFKFNRFGKSKLILQNNSSHKIISYISSKF